MYRHGFGDCFLVRFFEEDHCTFKILIDCGLKHNDSVPGISIEDVVKNIIEEVSEIGPHNKKTPKLDVLVITHEHWDHVSGFKPEKKLFDSFDIAEVWMAWTENPNDKVAQQINAHLKDNIAALAVAAKRLAKSTATKKTSGFYKNKFNGAAQLSIRENFNLALSSVLDFYGPLAITSTTASGIKIKDNFKVSLETEKAFDHVKTKLAKGKSAIKYFNAGTIMSEKDLIPGVRIYVLGPPKNAKINKDSPSKGAGKEVYLSADKTGLTGFVKGVLQSAGVDQGFDDGSPFTNPDMIIDKEAKKMPYYKNTYYKQSELWRNIDDDWLDMAGALALQMDEDTNNTSLVLAIELVESGKILLFPGDAQVGNWLSWHDHIFKVKNGSTEEEVTATDILNNTIFYKAGHHASHNATLKSLGLELMTHDDLVVFVPEKEAQYNNIPWPALVTSLEEKAKGRVLFSADKNYPPAKTLKTKHKSATKKEWDSFKKNLVVEELFLEFNIDV